ncbi:flagellar motor protein MotB [Myxococcus sp. K15C18031901]|uniref:flagellar motor protein MotB n=1 Tax=Myxococcus dinghuensis TaxID=2906761 RepID=UPI0020A7359D|nr:flagellar motor protein MotB [Myxococcus dinghuensis]MCP3097579.1 flagellar motor protein MotB [Myxococcus dinghuensis]
MPSRLALVLLSALSTVVVLSPSSASAQALPTFNLQRLELDPAALGSLVVSTGRVLPQGMVRVALQGHYEYLPLHFQTRWEPGGGMGLVENKFTADVTIAVGVLPWLQLDAEIPYILAQGGTAFRDVPAPKGSGMGSPWVGARVPVLNPDLGLHLAVDVSTQLPVGDKALLARDDFALHPSLQVGYLAEGWQVGGQVGVLVRTKRDLSSLSAESKDVIGDELRVAATVTSRAGELTRGEVSVLTGIPLQGGRMGAELLVAIRRHATSWLDLYVLGGPGVGAGMDTPTFRFIAGASFSTSHVD